MKGSHRIIVESRKVKYDFVIHRNITIITGDSGSGKTVLIDLIHDYGRYGADSGVFLSCDCPCKVIDSEDWERKIEETTGSIIFIDEGNRFLVSKKFAQLVQGSDNYFVLATREKLPALPYSVSEIYGFRKSGKFHDAKQKYNEIHHLYGEISEEKNIINKLIRRNMEMNQDTLEKMFGMNLKGMYYAFKTSLETHRTESMTTDQFVSWLISSEWDDRRNRAVERAIRQASFRYKATIEEIDFSVERGLDKNLTGRLADLTFVKERKDLFITGSAGTGKSYLATAFGFQACQKGYKVLYANTSRLMGILKVAKAKGTILQELKKIERLDMLILDDFGIQPFDSQGRMNLMDIIEDRHGKKSTVITSQVPVRDWYDVIGEKTIADAVLDRIVHQAIRIELFGESLRKCKSKKESLYL